ncbi:MAG: carboxypeptidase-like regulatory domain-containing protein [Myxococcaceae bacterium]|jgi:hypothetical protein|nr:carboxypeptidase-like regulatory domain-containing protein [Myxococcaceae bacterium]
MRLALPLCLAVLALGCLDPGNFDPDGGRGRVNCDTFSTRWPVSVVDFSGMPVVGATVTATNDTDASKKVTGQTDGRGIFLVDGKDLGSGAVSVVATFNGSSTNTGRFTFTPSECAGSVVEPPDLRLQLVRR